MDGTSEELLRLEREGWDALTSSGAAEFYGRVLDREIVMLLPGFSITDRDEAIRAMSGQPWSWHLMEDERVLPLGEDVGVVIYRVTAQREDQPEYRAVMSSTYVRRDGGWRMAVHQQTPL